MVIHPNDAESLGLPDDRFAENQIRPAAALIEALLALDSAPLDIPRSPGRRVIGTCRYPLPTTLPLSQSFMRAMSSEFLRHLSPEGALRRAAHLAPEHLSHG
jgi:hypothetical protein